LEEELKGNHKEEEEDKCTDAARIDKMQRF